MNTKKKKQVVVSGFATLDYVICTARPLVGVECVRATAHTDTAWPQAGGAALYTSKQLALNGHKATPIVHIGDDQGGLCYQKACLDAGLDTIGIDLRSSGRTPCCVLIYHEKGGYSCLLDVGSLDDAGISPVQLAQIETADMIVVAAAPQKQTEAVLDQTSSKQTLAWIVKDDPECFPLHIRKKLSQRANIIFFNQSERKLLVESKHPGQILVETKGADGVTLMRDGKTWSRLRAPLKVANATGAGDTLAGEVLAQILSGEDNFDVALDRGNDAARTLLLERVQSI